MSKYIDKGVLLERMNRTRPYEGEDGSFERHRRLQWLADIGQVNMCPTADVVEVKRGRNLDVEFPSLFECSECHWSCWDILCGDTPTYNYCPNCGASMMDGDTDV